MAGDWIKWQKGLARKPEVLMIAARLGRSRHEVAGVLMEVWEWADDNAAVLPPSGPDPDAAGTHAAGTVRLGEQSSSLLDAMTGVPGLADAMTAVGWLGLRNGSLVFPNFTRHNGTSAKARSLDSSRKREARAVTDRGRPPPVRSASGSEPDKSRTREEKRRGEESASAAQKSEPAGPRPHAREGPAPGAGRPPDPLREEQRAVRSFLEAWNGSGLKPIAPSAFNGVLRSRLLALLLDPWWTEHWREAVAKAAANPFLAAGSGRQAGRYDVGEFLRDVEQARKVLDGVLDPRAAEPRPAAAGGKASIRDIIDRDRAREADGR